MPIKSFADTSAVSIAYGLSDAADASEVALTSLNLIPFTTEGFTMSKEAKVSTAITDNRRITGSKNTKGTASGAVTVEFGANQFCLDFLQALLMNTWTTAGSSKTIFDSNLKQYMVVEKTVKPTVGAAEKQSHERFYGTLFNDGTLDFTTGEFMTLSLNSMSANADYKEAVQGADGSGGSLVETKTVPADYEIADSSNNLPNIVIKDDAGNPLEFTFSKASLKVENNVREQAGLGHVFAAGIGMGKVNVTLEGDIYYYDQTVLDMHMRNKRLQAEITVETEDGKFEIFLPSLNAQSPQSNAQGENQDYSTSITLQAQQGTHDSQDCVIYVKYTPAAAVAAIESVDLVVNSAAKTASVDIVTSGLADSTALVVTLTDTSTGLITVTPAVTVTSNAASVTSEDISSLTAGSVTVHVSAAGTNIVTATDAYNP